MGSCNCGHLAQQLTHRSHSEIHQLALEKAGDWGQHAVDHCPISGYPIDHIITTMVEAGMTYQDIQELERLSSHRVLRALPGGRRLLNHRDRSDVVLYMRTWAQMLADALRAGQTESSLEIERLARAGQIRTENTHNNTVEGTSLVTSQRG